MRILLIVVFSLTSLLSYSQIETTGTIKSKTTNSFELNYVLHKPKKTNELKPLIVFLHGSGEKGNDLEKVRRVGPLSFIKNNQVDAYILAPQCPVDRYWDSEELYLLIQKVLSENKINTSRIYLTGLSMGAWGSWNLAYAYPELFAALAPIAGFVDRVPMIEGCKIKNIPTRIYHGLLDNVVDISYSVNIYKKLRTCNKDIKLEIFETLKHDSWTPVYNDPAFYEWMLSNTKSN